MILLPCWKIVFSCGGRPNALESVRVIKKVFIVGIQSKEGWMRMQNCERLYKNSQICPVICPQQFNSQLNRYFFCNLVLWTIFCSFTTPLWPSSPTDMAQHGSVEQELWNIFTFYTLHGNPMYPDLLKSSQFSKLCKQCLIMKTPEMPNGLPGAVINVVYIGKFFFYYFVCVLLLTRRPGKRAVERYLVHCLFSLKSLVAALTISLCLF